MGCRKFPEGQEDQYTELKVTNLLAPLLTSKVLIIYGPLWLVAIVEGVALYYLWRRHEELHAKRLDDAQKTIKEYDKLVGEVNKTLEVLIKILSSR